MYKQLDLFGGVPEEKPASVPERKVPEVDLSESKTEEPAITAEKQEDLSESVREESVITAEKEEPASAQESKVPEMDLSASITEEASMTAEDPGTHIQKAISPGETALQPVRAERPRIAVTMPVKPEEATPEETEATEEKAEKMALQPVLTFLDAGVDDTIEEITLSEPPAGITVIAPKKGKRGRKSQKEMEAEAAAIEIPPDDILFKKQYYSIGEVSRMFNLNSSLLRYWESEFDIIKPRKNRKGDRHFRPEDIKNLYLIHHLLRARKYTIEGAKTYLKKNKNKASENFEIIQKLDKIKTFLLELKAGL